MGDLAALLERVKSATGPDRELDEAILLGLGGIRDGEYWRWPDENMRTLGGVYRFTGSIDVALALVERVLPAHHTFVAGSPSSSGWKILLYRGMTPTGERYASWECMIRPHAGKEEFHHAPTPPLAILAALLSALIAQPPTERREPSGEDKSIDTHETEA